ncbi:MAG: nucleoside transporter C-terminal domain-containing protein [Planctomycetota bacterium]
MPASVVTLSYAICGFANFTSIGVQTATFSGLERSLRHRVPALAFRAMLAGLLACWTTGCLAGVML